MKNKSNKAILALVIAFAFAMSAVVGSDPITNNNNEPESAAVTDFGFSVGDWFVYRCYKTEGGIVQFGSETMMKLEVTDLYDESGLTHIKWNILYANSTTNYEYTLAGTDTVSVDVTDETTLFNNRFFYPKDLNMASHKTYLDAQVGSWFNLAPGFVSEMNATHWNLTGVSGGADFEYTYILNPSLGVTKYARVTNGSVADVKALAESNRITDYPTDFGVEIGDTFKYWVPVSTDEDTMFELFNVTNIYEENEDIVLLAERISLNYAEVVTKTVKFFEAGRIIGEFFDRGLFARANVNLEGKEAELTAFFGELGFVNISILELTARYYHATADRIPNSSEMEGRLSDDITVGVKTFQKESWNGEVLNVMILMEGKGMTTNYPFLDFAVGTTWTEVTYLNNYYQDKVNPDNSYHSGAITFTKKEITHIIRDNLTCIVVGNMWTSSQNSFAIEPTYQGVYFMAYDPTDINVATLLEPNKYMHKYGLEREGAFGSPLLPNNINFIDLQTALLQHIGNAMQGAPTLFDIKEKSYAIALNQQNRMMAEVDETGLVSFWELNHAVDNETVYSRVENRGYLLTINDTAPAPVAQTFGFKAGDELVFENSDSSNPSRKYYTMIKILNPINLYNGGKLFFFQQKSSIVSKAGPWTDEDYNVEGSPGTKQNKHFKYGLKPNDEFSFMEASVLPKEQLNSFNLTQVAFAFSFGFGVNVQASNININGSKITTIIDLADGSIATVKVVFNEEGIIQDQLIINEKPGSKTWQRMVLVSGPGAKYEVFENPEGYIPSDELPPEDDDDDEPEQPQLPDELAGIDGFPVAIFSLISFAAIAVMIKRKKNIIE